MTWGYVAGAAATVVGGAIQGRKSRKAAEKEGKRNRAAAAASGELLETGYQQAEERLTPFIESEGAANRQLMIEMGLTPDRTGDITATNATLDDLRQQLSDIEGRPDFSQLGGLGGFMGAGFNPGAMTAANEARSEELRARIAEEETRLSGFQSDEPLGEPGTAYMQTPAYQAAIDQGVATVNQGAATSGSLYSGRRGEALKDVGQGAQQSYYNNYMNILQNMANPTTATNLSNIGIDKAGTIGAQNIASQQVASNFNLAGVEAQGQATADIFGGISSGISAYMNRPQQLTTQQQPSTIPATSSAWV